MNLFAQSHQTQSADTPGLVRNAILVLEPTPAHSNSFRVKQANPEAEQWVKPLAVSLCGATLDQLPPPFNSVELAEQIRRVYGQSTSVQFQLRQLDIPTQSVRAFDCQLLAVEPQLLILSLVALAPEPMGMESLEQVLEAMPTGLILFRAIRDSQNEIIDFQAVLCNQIGAAFVRQRREDILTRTLGQRYPTMRGHDIFQQYTAVTNTGQPHHQLLFLPSQHVWLDVSVTPYGDGVLVAFLDVTQNQQTASLLERVMSSSPAAVRYYEAIRDESGQIVDFMTSIGNELAAYRSYRPVESTVGKRLLDLYPSVKGSDTFQRYVTVVESGESDHFETHYQVQDKVVWFDCTAVSHANGFVLTLLDITVLKEAQLAQQRQADFLQTVLDNSLTGMAWLKPVYNRLGEVTDFTLEQINATMAKTLGQPPQAITGGLLSELMPHQMVNGLFDQYATALRTGESRRFEWSNAAATVWYDIAVVPVADGLNITFLDITASKLAHLDLERQADLIQGVLNNTTGSIAVLEPVAGPDKQVTDFRVMLANPATIRLFTPFLGREFTLAEFQTHTLRSLFPPVKERALFAALLAVVGSGKPIHSQVDYPDLGLTYDYDLAPYRNGVLMITTDITPLRVYQQQLEANNIALSRSNEYLQQFAYVASHDLQEPLRKIQSFGGMMLTQYADKLDEVGQDLLRRQQNAAARMQRLIKDLLDYSRLSTQQLPYQPVSFQVLIQGVLSDLETVIRQKGAQVQVGELPTLNGNETQLRQLLQNLISNALKFSRPGQAPRVWVEAQLLAADQLPPSASAPVAGPWMALSVTDNGIGFDAMYESRIFELFQRLHGHSQYTGTGIGLAVVKKVVENHRGFVMAHSQPGAGATFTVYLPLA